MLPGDIVPKRHCDIESPLRPSSHRHLQDGQSIPSWPRKIQRAAVPRFERASTPSCRDLLRGAAGRRGAPDFAPTRAIGFKVHPLAVARPTGNLGIEAALEREHPDLATGFVDGEHVALAVVAEAVIGEALPIGRPARTPFRSVNAFRDRPPPRAILVGDPDFVALAGSVR